MDCLLYAEGKISKREKEEIKKMVVSFFEQMKKKGEVSVHLVEEKTIKMLNKKFRGIDRVTDVLSFSAQEGQTFPAVGEDDWGEIFVCLPQIKKQAVEFGVSYENELKRMVAHGLLHLWGYDHVTKIQEKKMFSVQEKMVSFLEN
jgi:probable rRNA maturation factor